MSTDSNEGGSVETKKSRVDDFNKHMLSSAEADWQEAVEELSGKWQKVFEAFPSVKNMCKEAHHRGFASGMEFMRKYIQEQVNLRTVKGNSEVKHE